MYDGRTLHVGIGLRTIHVEDIVVLPLGAETPFIFHPISTTSKVGKSGELPRASKTDSSSRMAYELVGDCYIHGLMNGEAFDLGLKEEKFILV
jgi:hypothetical protein